MASDVGMGRNLIADAPSLADELAGGDSQQVLMENIDFWDYCRFFEIAGDIFDYLFFPD